MEYKQTRKVLWLKSCTLWLITGFLTAPYDILKYKRTKLAINDRSLTYYYGLITQKSRDLPYRNIQTVSVNQTVIGMVLGYGHVIVATNSAPLEFKYVAKPQLLREMIQSHIRN